MNDPKLIEAREEPQLVVREFYRHSPEPAEGWPDRATNEALLKSLNVAHANMEELRKANNTLGSQVAGLAKSNTSLISNTIFLKNQLGNEVLWRWGIFVALSLTVIALLYESLQH